MFTTTPQIVTDHFVSLADPKNTFAAQNVTPLVYTKGVNSTIVSTLNAVSAALTTEALVQMDKALTIDHASYTAGGQRVPLPGRPEVTRRMGVT